MTKTGTSPAVRVLALALTEEERAVLEAEAGKRHVSMSLIVRELLSDRFADFAEATRERGPGGRPLGT